MGSVIQKVFVFGNPDLPLDALPILMLSSLREGFPTVTFLFLDPNEEWEIPDPLIIIDTVVGISAVRVFRDLESFVSAPALSVHDFDAFTQLRFLKKLGKLGRVAVIGVPSEADFEHSATLVASALRTLIEEFSTEEK